MKILLVNPPRHSKYFSSGGTEPLGLESIAAMVPEDDVEIIDLRFEKKAFKDIVRKINPDIVGVTGYTVDVYNMKRILFETKLFNNDIKTIVGGAHVSVAPEDFNETYVDVVVVGLGEITFKAIIDSYKKNTSLLDIEGIGTPSACGMRLNKKKSIVNNLDELPLPRRDLTHKYHKCYTYMGLEVGLIATARGCPFRCHFCSIPVIMGGKYFTRSASNVFEEIKSMPQKLIRFADGNTFGNLKRMEELYLMIKEAKLDKKFIFDVRTDFIVKHKDMIEKYRSIGFEIAAVGLESIDDSKLDSFNKQSSCNVHEQAIKILHELNIKILGQFVIDQTFSSKDFDVLNQFVCKHKIQFPSYSILTPFPGTKIFDEYKHKLLTKNYELFDLFHSVVETSIDRREFFDHFANLYLKSYSTKRILASWKDRIINFFNPKATRVKGPSFIMIFLIKVNILLRIGQIRNAYRVSC